MCRHKSFLCFAKFYCFVLISFLCCFLSSYTLKAKAYNENRISFGTLKNGKTNTQNGLTYEKNVIALDFDVTEYSSAIFEVSAVDVTGDLSVKITCSTVDSSAIIKELLVPSNNEINWKYCSEGLFAPGKYFLVIDDAGKGTLTGKIKSTLKLDGVKIYDDGNNNTSDHAQKQEVDGKERTYVFAKLYTWGIKGDDDTDWIKFSTDTEGVYLRLDPLNSYNGQIRMELYKGQKGKTPELLYNYYTQKTKELFLKSLPAGNYFLKIMFDCYDDVSERSFASNQVVYDLTLAPYVELEKISFVDPKVTLGLKGEVSSCQTKIKMTPEKVAIKKVTWESSDTKVATVTDGIVKAVKSGNATITCIMTDINGNSKKAKCTVEVKSQTVTLDVKNLSLEKGAKTVIKAKVSPKESVTWYSEDKSIAKINKKGEISAIKAGKTKIYAKTKSGVKSATCTVTVTEKKVEVPKNPKKTEKVNDSGKDKGSNVDNKNPLSDMTLKSGIGSIDVGFKTKVTRYLGPEKGTWVVNDCLEIVSYDDYSVTVRGIKKGKGYVSFASGGYSMNIAIDVE